MLYLARVYPNAEGTSGFFLKLLAQEDSDQLWSVIDGNQQLHLSVIPPELGSLVLVETHGESITSITDATTWVVKMIQDYLTIGMTPEMLSQEADRAEKFRQSLTLQARELDRKTTELEARMYRSQS